MSQNNCTPQNIYGGFSQTIFLGCSVTGFTASVGWNEQSSTCTISLVEDPCTAPESNPKVYYDANLAQQTTTAADPGFVGENGDIIGCPAYFRLADFEFAGLVQSWTKSNSSSGNPTYQVVLIDPREILQGCQVIIGEYAGGINKQASGCVAGGSIAPYNVFNVFGYMEQFGVACPEYSQGTDGPIFGTPAGGFGGSNRNQNGMQWSRIQTGFDILANSGTVNQWSPHGAVVYKGPATSAGYGLIGGNYDSNTKCSYLVDISKVGASAPSYYRLNNMSVSVMEMINQVCEDSGCDYYIQLLPCQGSLVISVSTVSRTSQPALGSIQTFIDNSTGVISKTIGRESRNETTSSFLVGGNKQTIFQASSDFLDMEGDPGESDDIILPFFGFDTNKDMIIPTKDGDGYWEFTVETWEINQHLKQLALAATVTINEKELMFAEGGFDGWASWITLKQTDTNDALNALMKGIFNIDRVVNQVANNIPLNPGDIVGGLVRNWFTVVNSVKAQMEEDVRAIHNWVNKFATEYYGRKFAVRVPYSCGWADSESGKVMMSAQPGDAGWTEVTDVIGLPDGALLDFFRGDDGRLGAFVRYPNALNGVYELDELDPNDIGIYNNKLYVRASVDQEYVYHTWATKSTPRAVVTISKPVLEKEDEVEPKWLRAFVKLWEWGQGLAAGDAEDQVMALAKEIGAKDIFETIQSRSFMPDAAAIPIHSNILCYGPWVGVGPPGQCRVSQETGLVPWEYGGCATMSTAGAAIATDGLTNMTVGERGTVQLAGYPTMPLGAELGAMDAGFFGAGTHLYENRTLTSTPFSENDYDGNPVTATIYGFSWAWTGSYGPSITDISVDVGPGGIETTYNFRTYTPKYGRFAKANAERLKSAGKGSYLLGKKLRAWSLKRAQQGAALIRGGAIRRAAKNLQGRIAKAGSPHRVFIGDLTSYPVSTPPKSWKRPQIETLSMAETPTEMNDHYPSRAFMSIDGLMRPISMDGDGGLPRYAQSFKAACQYNAPEPMIPPFYKNHIGGCASLTPTGTEKYAGKETNDFITATYLNPFSNPSGYDRDELATIRSNTPSVGHDMEILGRAGTGDNNTPESGLNMVAGGYNDSTHYSDYRDDYRAFALRGPLIIKGWGYDTNGKPIPNSADSEGSAEVGTFTATGLTNKFLDEHLRKSHTWPVGPVDLRWDRSRRVWVCPPAHRIVRIVSCERYCSNGSQIDEGQLALGFYYFWGKLKLGNQATYDENGNQVYENERLVKVFAPFNRINVYMGDTILAYYDAHDCRYYMVNQSEHLLSVEWDRSECPTGESDAEETGNRWPVRSIKFGDGLQTVPYNSILGEASDVPYAPTGDPEGFCVMGVNVSVCQTGMMQATSDDECITGIGGDTTEISGGHLYRQLSVGKGLFGRHIDNDTFGISLGFKIDNQVVTDLSLCECLTLETGAECEATLCLATGTGAGVTDVEVVTNVWLDDGTGTGTGCHCELSFETTFLKFSDCGLFLGTGDTPGATGLTDPVGA